ncbi:L-seryl-tRNA(Sec) selenium transferase [Shewanella marina]|uniref:L-seryl-tRNA(Sec) selenium transferase n=1 Tax=Shewanella marina TaxID=487319 RepID=UPI000472AE2E|nr:L-seryl-tRNA(Sec) selenium transferase [Shewanella marina]
MTQAINSLKALYRCLPALDSLLQIPQVIGLQQCFGEAWIKQQIRLLLDEARQHIKQHQQLPIWCHSSSNLVKHLQLIVIDKDQHSMQGVMNLTGTILHTNLGRSQMSQAAIDAVTNVMRQPIPLEFDMGLGKRGHRDSQISELLHELTGAEACCLVNNNAAAVLLMLAAVAPGKEVIVSRGELVEIGGAFRIPDIMRQAGCTLVEVGCTNRTHLQDYANAITDNTAAIMKVHTSNYHIAGFTASVEEAELAKLCQQRGIQLISDLGSGALVDLAQFGLAKEPMPQQMLKEGVNLVSFSGDKLLGGPQAGLVVGDKQLIDKLQAHPLKRALRCDKMTLAALEATLRLYRQPEQLTRQLPMLAKLAKPLADINYIAHQLLQTLPYHSQYQISVNACSTQIGSGSQPDQLLASMALCIATKHKPQLLQLDKQLKQLATPIIGRIHADQLWLDLRGCDDERLLHQQLSHLLSRAPKSVENNL